MPRKFATLTLTTLGVAAACGGADRHSDAPSTSNTAVAGRGVTGAAPVEPDTVARPPLTPAPANSNPARRPSQRTQELLALRSNLLSEPIAAPKPAQALGGAGGGSAGTGGTAPVFGGGTSGGNPSRGGALDK